ncbi:MAG: PD-(D/E)XK nuclease family protein [Treponema sp.]|nr:PD-(D/E)XK nuclease family protein [Treponema sp.]
MKVTNRLHLPEAFVKAVSVERHNKAGQYSATTLNKGVKGIILQERHWEEFTVDAADSVWATFGTAFHAIMEKYEDGNFHEEKFDIAVSNSRVTGVVDSYDMERGIINDWKTASVYKVMKGDFADWYKQGMTYAWLLKQNGLDVHKCRFIACLKDHSMTKAETDRTYPQAPVFIYEFEVTPEELAQTGERITAKVKAIEAAEKQGDDDIEPCTPEERWADGDKWAVMKNGRKTAIRVFDAEIDAENCAGELGNSHYVEHRPAVSRKCGKYCLISFSLQSKYKII